MRMQDLVLAWFYEMRDRDKPESSNVWLEKDLLQQMSEEKVFEKARREEEPECALCYAVEMHWDSTN